MDNVKLQCGTCIHAIEKGIITPTVGSIHGGVMCDSAELAEQLGEDYQAEYATLGKMHLWAVEEIEPNHSCTFWEKIK